MPGISFVVIAVTFLLTLGRTAYCHEIITRTSDGHNVTMTQMVAETANSDVVLIGESHNNRDHHDLELALIRSLWEKNRDLAIGLEMFQSDSQQALDDWTEGRMNETAFQAVFTKNWSLDWDMYRGIFLFAREKRIPMIALNVPMEIVRKVAHHGFASLTDEERRNLPQGTSCDLNNPHTAFLKKTFQEVPNHRMNQQYFTFFCEAQTLRNSGMALNITRYLKSHPGRKVVGLTGIWHAIKNAIPEQLERNGGKGACTVIIPETPELALKDGASAADYLVDL